MRRLFAALIALSLASVPTVAMATHVQEPTAPVTGLKLQLLKYPDPATIVDCSIVANVTFDLLRVDAFVLAAAAPSEHFRVQAAIYKLDDRGGGPQRASSVAWSHQNAPPHAPVANPGWYAFAIDQPNLSQHQAISTNTGLRGGLWRVVITITGHESGAEFTQTCTFRKIAP